MEEVGKLFSANEFFESYNWIVLYYTSSYLNIWKKYSFGIFNISGETAEEPEVNKT